MLQAAQCAADEIAAIPSRAKPLAAPAAATAAAVVSVDSDVDWSKFTVVSETVAYRRFLQVRNRFNLRPNTQLHLRFKTQLSLHFHDHTSSDAR